MLAPGDRLGRYTIVELLAVGGMGEVYRAEDARLGRDVAIKVLPSHLADDKGSFERFHREARAVAALSHPNILAIFDFGSEGDVHYAVTELLEGETLRARLSRGRFTPRGALEVLLDIAEGVAAAHERGIVHRDLKPENIFLTRDGRVKVLDFGIARGHSTALRAAGPHAPTEALPTEPGMVLGTAGYLAPEQVEARPATPATDVFALGCVLYEMLAGDLPFARGSSARSLVAVLHDPPPHLDGTEDSLSRDVDALVQACLRKDPRERPSNGGALAEHVRALLAGQRLSQAVREERRGWRLPYGIEFLALALVVTLLGVIFTTRNRQLDHGYDLRASDVRGDRETKRLLQLALRADAEGNRPKALQLLEEASRRGSASALPAAFLSSFIDASGDAPRGAAWSREAMRRLKGAGTYESLLVRYLAEPSANRSRELALAKSALDLRPAAWRLRLAAAHIHLSYRDHEAARRELQRIDVRQPDDRRLMLVLADRASLGDPGGAERDLRSSRLVKRAAFFHYTLARIAWSRGDTRGAAVLFDRAADEAANEGLGAIEAEAGELAALAHLRLGNAPEAQRRLARSTARAREAGLTYRTFTATALAAYAAHRAGDDEERDRKLRAAAAFPVDPEPRAALRLLAIRLGSREWQQWSVASIAAAADLQAATSLIRARDAWSRGDTPTAARELGRARAEGIDRTGLREEAELLAAELGLPAQLLRPEPPYPNITRFAAIFDLERRPREGR